MAAHCVAVLAICSAVGLDGRADFGVGLELVADNMRIYGAPMPRRKNRNAAHEAAAEGKERLLLQVLHVMEAGERAKEVGSTGGRLSGGMQSGALLSGLVKVKGRQGRCRLCARRPNGGR